MKWVLVLLLILQLYLRFSYSKHYFHVRHKSGYYGSKSSHSRSYNKYDSYKLSDFWTYKNSYNQNYKYGYKHGYKTYYTPRHVIDNAYDKNKDYWANKWMANNEKNPYNWDWHSKKYDISAWMVQFQKLSQWKKSQDQQRYDSPSAGCSDGKILYCWNCKDVSSSDDCKNNANSYWEKCEAGESCYYEQSVQAGYGYKYGYKYGYSKAQITFSRGCMKESSCRSGKPPCKGSNNENCRECGLGCWYKCEHPPCPYKEQCRICEGTRTEKECVAQDEYETCPSNIKDPVCEESWQCAYKSGSSFYSRCVERISCLSKQRMYNMASWSFKNVECKPAYCPKPEPTTTTKKATTTTTKKPTTTTTTTTTTTPPPCPGPGEDYLDYKDRKKMTVNLIYPFNANDDPYLFLRGFPRDKDGLPEPLFFVQHNQDETKVEIKFKNKKYNIRKVFLLSKFCDWVEVKLFRKGKKNPQLKKKIPAEHSAKHQPWKVHELEISASDGNGITRMEFSFGYQTAELRAQGAFFTVCP